ncbi:MFS transporter [Micromonospora mirobrigensis]|uniref:Predicted arabinose efflux permease, MFS family n=1 Tax=Micromonospora mirobrigensis TaxID=262898 RepID=A0A1C4W773_9ACTN|nr:MFS transporter [Micromonospora mirobrigensis]SCE92066.1 Predicted arabinose efflux permease, MFS family [Micromonospora mirobrigensis]
MTVTTARVPDTSVRRLAATLYGYAFLTDAVLLYPLYPLLFSETGLSVGQISSLFVLWSVTAIALEVPSGAWADAVSRRLLLCLAPLLAGAGFAVWVFLPSYPAFALGFLLWGAGGALASGALEALVFTELDRLGAAGRYARTMGRARTAGVLGTLVAAALAGPALAAGGYPAVGVASVLACLLAAALAGRFPEHHGHEPAGAGGPTDDTPAGGEAAEAGWGASLRAGLAEARTVPAVGAAVLLLAVVAAVWGALDEYTPLLIREAGVPAAAVPALVALVLVGVTVGGLAAPLGERLRRRGYAALLAVSALALAVGAGSGRPTGLVLVAAGFGGLQLATVLADARLQARITGPSRATVTSLAGLVTDLAVIAVYAGYVPVEGVGGHRWAFAVAAAAYLVVAGCLLVARRPAQSGRASR